MTEDERERDRRLVAAARGGDVDAFERLYRAHKDWVYAVALRSTGHREDALDVAQEAFSYLLRKLPELELTARLTTLLYPAIRHLAEKARTKRGRFRSDDELLEAFPSSSEPEVGSREDLAAVLRALPGPQREVLFLRYADDLALEEVADALALPVGTVKSRIHHALQALRADPRTRGQFDGWVDG